MDDSDIDAYPKDMTDGNDDIKMDYDANDKDPPRVSFYFFYKAIGVEGLHLDLNWNNILSNGNKTKDIAYSVYIHDGSPWGSIAGSTHWESDINLSEEHTQEANLYQIDVTVITPIDASYASSKTYTTTFTLSIKAQ